MSHTVKVETKIKASKLAQLKKALGALGWTINEKCAARTYPSDPQRGKIWDLVAVNPQATSNAYDVGIKINGDDVELHCDFYGGSIAATLGEGMNKLKQGYSAQVITDELEGQGYFLTSKMSADGTLIMEAEQY